MFYKITYLKRLNNYEGLHGENIDKSVTKVFKLRFYIVLYETLQSVPLQSGLIIIRKI